MNIPHHIIEFLKESNIAVIEGFGIFSLKSKSASVHDDGYILPPTKEISFRYDETATGKNFEQYIAIQEKTTSFSVELELKKYVSQWKAQLQRNETVYLDHVGKLCIIEDEVRFAGNEVSEQNSDFYGFEGIKISEIKNTDSDETPSESVSTPKDSYQFNNSILWVFLIAIPVAALAYIGYTQQELIFGKKSFEKVSVKPLSEIRTTKKIDSAKTTIDSSATKADSATSRLDTISKSQPKTNASTP